MTQPLFPRSLRVVALFSVLAGVGGCEGDGISITEGPGIRPIGGDAAVPDGGRACGAPDEGCACGEGDGPIDCYNDPIFDGDRVVCRGGTRYCRDGVWGACESLVDFELPGGGSALLTGPSVCNPCDPRCFGYSDHPDDTDLTPMNSDDVSYDPIGGGITLTGSMPMTPVLPDSDGDGVPDVGDMCVGAGAFVAADGSCYGDTFFYHLLEYGGPAATDSLDIQVQIRTADVYFLIDTTGSMGGELARLQADINTGNFHPTDPACGGGVAGAIRCAIPDAWFGVGFFDDYPVNPYGGGGDFVYRNVLDITSSMPATNVAVDSLSIHWGNDGPESNTQALWAVASGGGLRPYLGARVGCPAGTWGYPCFRNGTIPIIIHVTDAPFHNGPAGAYPYAFSWGAGVVGVTGNEGFTTAYDAGNVTTWAEYSGTTSGMANDVAAGCSTTTAGDAVFRFTIPAGPAQTVTFRSTGSSYDTSIALYQRIVAVPTAVTGNDTTGTAFVIADPTGLGGIYTGTTAGATNNLGSGSCGSSTAPDVFFRFTLAATATLTFDTVGSSYDTVLHLYNSSAGVIACNDDTVGLASRITATLAAGTYYVGVDGYGGNSGNYVLNFGAGSTATFLECNDDGPSPPSSEIVRSLPAGDYYVVVDGRNAATGNYHIGFGVLPSAASGPTGPVSWADTLAALNARDVRVITFQTCGGAGWCADGTPHANALAYGTSSVDGTGSPYVFAGSATGAGLSSAIVNAVVNLANYSRMDISARAVGDMWGFTQLPITAVSWGPLGSCNSISGGTTFLGCLPGTQVNFNVQFRNTTVMPTMVAQTFTFFIEVVGDGTIVLERIPVLIVVPPSIPTYPASGNYVRDYDSTVRCGVNERPIWGTMQWDVPSLPAGTGVRFELTTADSAAGLDTATPVATVTVPAVGAGSASITNALTAAGALPRLYFLRVNAILTSSPDRFSAPTLRSIDLSYTCIPDE